jgi:DNA polymerase-3 subunit delta'
VVRLEKDAQQIKVEQIRALIDSLSLSSYRRGFKVAIVEGAEALNASGANAFLKTLEEPSGDALLILIARPSHRLPATIASRCLRLSLRPPAPEEALAWLRGRAPHIADWGAALALAGGAPLMAEALEAEGSGALEQEMQDALKQLSAGALDVSLLAERWVKSNLGLRLIWLENWITQRIRASLGGAHSVQSAESVRLPAALLKPKIRALFALQDAARDMRRLASTGLNQQLALEGLLLGGRAALSK